MTARFLTSTLVLLFLFGTAATIQFQTDQARKDLVQSIEHRAQQDAESESAKATPQDLNVLFGKQAEAAGLNMAQVAAIYDRVYLATKQDKPWWRVLLPNAGWILAVILFFLLILQDAVRKAISDQLDKVLKTFYRRAAGYKVFQQKALTNYKKALVKKYARFKIPFRSERDLDMSKIYIPLKIKGYDDTDLINDSDIVERFKRIVVTGAPGSGKSMLLKRMALSYATKNVKTNEKTPVLVDLRRFNEGDKSLFQHLISTLELNDFPNAGSYIEASLVQGNLLLLFDGLDEVANVRLVAEPTKRETVVTEITELLDRYENCSAIITCRTAVYRRDFDDIAERTLEIIEFSDQQIQHFLMSWPDPPADKSIEQLIASLSERPAILALARNPLLLTIVAFLYTDMAEFVLPYSRTEFYTQAVDVLLQQLKGKLNRYRVAPKLLVLEHLALFNQEKAPGVSDRLTIDDQTVIKLITELLPSLNLEAKDVRPLIEEIVERSNLLLEVDNKTKYQFFHLTLQEFFAATSLRNDPKKLLDNFRANKDAWRETIKLWCGLPHNSTELIKEVFALDPLTAFECLADAPMVDQLTADSIINEYKPLLGKPNEQKEAITKAFAGVSAGRGQRGLAVLSFLIEALTSPRDFEVRKSAAEALALSNKHDAVMALSDRYDIDPEVVRHAIIKMGDIAVPSLKRLAENSHKAAINALQAIGTAKAMTALVPLLWHEQDEIQSISALKLAKMISAKNSFSALQNYPVTALEKNQPSYDWVWSPFSNSTSDCIIMGRIAFLLDHLKPPPTYNYDHVEADWRVVIPLVLKESESEKINLYRAFDRISTHELRDLIQSWFPASAHAFINSVATRVPYAITGSDLFDVLNHLGTELNAFPRPELNLSAKGLLEHLQVRPRLACLVQLMSPGAQLLFVPCLINRTPPSMDHWKHITRPKRALGLFWPYTLVLALIFVLSGMTLLETIMTLRADWFSWRCLFYLYLCASVVAGWSILSFGPLDDDKEEYFGSEHLLMAAASIIYPYFLFDAIRERLTGAPPDFGFWLFIQLFFASGFLIALTLIPTLHLLRYFSGTAVLLVWLAVGTFLGGAAWVIRRHMDRYDNPLRDFFRKVQRA